jgi:peptidoglycan/LPS O-acetylase OafA/YrhL
VYLIHLTYFYTTSNALKEKSGFGTWWTLHIHIADFVIVTVLGAMLYLLIEAPTVRILEMIWNITNLKKTDKSQKLEKICLI